MRPPKIVIEVREALGALVDDDRAGADADGDLGRVGAHGAAADDDDLGLRHAGDAAEEHAAAAVVLLHVGGAGLDGQLAGDLAHREEQGWAPFGISTVSKAMARMSALIMASVSWRA